MRRPALLALCALAFAAPAHAKPLLGINGNLPRFKVLTGQESTVHQAFLAWGQGLSFGSPFPSLFDTLTPMPMIHLGTAQQPPVQGEAISPAGIAAGAGDAYLIALNQAIFQWAKAIYVRPMAEMNNSANLYAAFDASGIPRPGHSPSDYRKAFARVFLILHGGSAGTIDAQLDRLDLPLVGRNLPVNPFPRLRVVWSPLAGGSPHVPANSPQQYYPGAGFVDVEGGDIFDEGLTDAAPWSGLEELYRAALGRRKPFSVPEWGLFSGDDPVFVRHMCTFLRTHRLTEEAAYYQSRPGSVLDLERKPESLKVYRQCITPYAAALPGWTTKGPGGQLQAQPAVTFTAEGRQIPRSAVGAPLGVDELAVNVSPLTGAIASAFWRRNGRAVGPLTVARRASGLVFTTGADAPRPEPLSHPAGATGFHVIWNPATGVITSASWLRVGRLLARIPVGVGQTSIAMGWAG